MSKELSHTQNPFESHYYSRKVAAVLERDLGLGRKQACVLLLPGNHVITPESLAVLTTADMVGGEFDKDGIVKYMIKAPPLLPVQAQGADNEMRFRYPGIGADPEQFLYHHRAVRKLIKDGITIFTSDGSIAQVKVDYDETPLHLQTMLGVWQLGSLVGNGLLAAGVALKAHLDRRRFLSLALATGAAGAITLGAKGTLDWLEALDKPGDIPLGRHQAGEWWGRQQIAFEEMKDKLGLEENIFETFSGSLIDVRNATMVLNSLHSLATSVGKSRFAPLVMALLHGNSHGEIEDLLAGGVKSIELAVDKFVTNLLTKSLNRLIPIHDEEYGECYCEDRINYSVAAHLQGYAGLFSDPYKVGGPQWPEDNLAASYIPPTARTVLIDRAREVIAELRAIGSAQSTRKARILSKLVILLWKDILSERRALLLAELQFNGVYPAEKKVEDIAGYNQLEKKILLGENQFFEAEQSAPEDNPYIYVNYGSFVIPSGVVKYHGAYHPVYRGYQYVDTEDKVVAADAALLPRNQYIKLPKREYLRTDGDLQLAEGELLVRLRFDKDGQPSLFVVDPIRSNNIGRPNDIYFREAGKSESDPLKIGAVALELEA